jgi:phosphinothricin acetyltransferase
MNTSLRPNPALILRAPRPADCLDIKAIHAEGLATGHACFRDRPIEWGEFEDSFAVALVAQVAGSVVGWAGVSAASPRPVLAGVGEVSVFVAAACARRGIGRTLLGDVIRMSEAAGWWTLAANVFPENARGLRLLARCGFEALGTRRRLGLMAYGPMARQWRDVVMLERRSATAGR